MNFICLALLALCVPTSAFAWGAATHAYFARDLGDKFGIRNTEEMVYGSMLPDMFNLMFGSDYKDFLWNQTHYDFMKVVDMAEGMQLKAFAYGFTSHNDDWGADYTAHHDGRTTPGNGYVISKVDLLKTEFLPMLKGILVDARVPEAMAELIAKGLAPSLTENFVETAIDLMIKRNEYPEVGTMMLHTGQLPDFGQPSLLESAYMRDFAREFNLPFDEAGKIITGAEEEYRELMKYYGTVFTKEESEAIELLAVYAATLGEEALKALTGYEVTLSPEVLTDFLCDYAIPNVEEDYSTEVSATLAYLEDMLRPVSVDEDVSPVAKIFLGQNQPNPFNSTTMIEYYLHEANQVKIVVYNALGQEVDILVDVDQAGGYHNVMWDAGGESSGIYFYRLETGTYSATNRMLLIK